MKDAKPHCFVKGRADETFLKDKSTDDCVKPIRMVDVHLAQDCCCSWIMHSYSDRLDCWLATIDVDLGRGQRSGVMLSAEEFAEGMLEDGSSHELYQSVLKYASCFDEVRILLRLM